MVTKSEIETAARNPHLAQRLAGGPVAYKCAGTELIWVDGTLDMAVGILTLAILKLPENLKAVIVARYAHNVTFADFGQDIGRTRERARQLEAKALRILRHIVGPQVRARLQDCLAVQFIKGGPADPDWLSVPEAGRLTDLSGSHILHLGRTDHVVKRINPARRCAVQINRASLREYVLNNPAMGRRRKGIWIEEVSHE